MPDPQFIQVKKYPNRRLYDRTRSQHLTHAELYDLVVRGHTVSVTDSRTGADITNLVLAQALIERSPEKFAAFPPEAFHLFIRASEEMLRAMTDGLFSNVVRGFQPTASGAARDNAPPVAPWAASFPSPFPPMPPFASAWAGPNAGAAAGTAADAVAELRERMESLAREIASLKSSAAKSP